MSPARPKQTARVRAVLHRYLSPARVQHSRRVAVLAAHMCRRFGVNPHQGIIAGLGHDVARELDPASVRDLAARDGLPVDRDEQAFPVLLHGRAGAVILRCEAAVGDETVLEAIRNHVTGRAGMGVLSRILFAADYLEPGRGFLPEEERRRVLESDLDTMVRYTVTDVIAHLESRRRPVARLALELQAELEGLPLGGAYGR